MPINPCQPSPCGPSAQCRVVNDSPSCSCLLDFVGAPPNCRPECVSNSECAANLACLNQKCRDPCPGACGSNTECRVVSHTPMCVCMSGYTGDPFTQCVLQQRKLLKIVSRLIRQASLIALINLQLIFLATVFDNVSPCTPSPCGANAVCKEQNGAGSCTCLQDYIGNPYEGCRPECTVNSDCVSSLACVRSKCQDPCPGTCGQNAVCQVINHSPACTCTPGFTGDPFRYCNPAPLSGNCRNTIL